MTFEADLAAAARITNEIDITAATRHAGAVSDVRAGRPRRRPRFGLVRRLVAPDGGRAGTAVRPVPHSLWAFGVLAWAQRAHRRTP